MKLFLFLILSSFYTSSFATLGHFKLTSGPDISEYQAFKSLMLQFETKANITDPTTKWYEILEKVLLLPFDDIMKYLEKTRPLWIDQLANGYITNAEELRNNFPAGETSTAPQYSVKQQIDSINDGHSKIEATLHLVRLGLADPKIGHIEGFEKAYKKFEKKKINDKYLDKIQKELPSLKAAHDELSNKITSQLDTFVAMRDAYMDKLDAIHNKNEVSFSNALTQIKEAQDFFLAPLYQLSKDVNACVAEALKCAELVMETKNLHFNPTIYEKKLKDKAEKEKKEAEKQAEKKRKAAEKAQKKKP
ncbi:uncharacterized protein LOC116348048 isoform X2 [Contarinia nasturtii]|uniref:uncharacterized protein LOC116348048 isoform X2 n=1 Tax=Contarinia nasturtii TaxID=265458 RepID=UPI0012D48048|nr:uncharacterized protein LOC116348048 isoform X2 [Contarinia nasturtii]